MEKTTSKRKVVTKYSIEYNKKYLFLNCPKCKEIPFLSFNQKNPEKIHIKCDKCLNNSEIDLNNYLSLLSDNNLFNNKNKCSKHNNYLDIFCYNCHIQFCSKCEEYNQHISHTIKNIKQKISLEKVENAKKILESNKQYLEKYISDFMNGYIKNFPKSRHYFITNNLIKPYINDMKIFFQFCECVLLNYDVFYPNYYQQSNLNKLLYYLSEKSTLLDLKERKLEKIFKYKNNNFINKKLAIENNNLEIKITLSFFPKKILKSLVLDDDLILIAFRDNLNTLQVYNYRNKQFISEIKTNTDNSSYNIKLKQINKDIFAIIFYEKYYSCTLKVYSIYSNNILFEKAFNFIVKIIKKVNYNSFGIVYYNKIEIYKSNEKFENISKLLKSDTKYDPKFEISTNIKTQRLYDFIITSNQLYLIALTHDKIILYKKKDLYIFKEIKIKEEDIDIFTNINELNDGTFILGGRIIATLNINKCCYTILYNDKIPRINVSYLTGTEKNLNYSNFILTYFNKLICKRKYVEILKCHYDDVDDEILKNEKALCIFNFNYDSNIIEIIKIDRSNRISNLYMNNNDEIIITNENEIQVCYSD